jgi:hypothetical protein
MSSLRFGVLGALAIAAASTIVSVANATTYQFTVDGSSGTTLGTGPWGTVDVNPSGSNLVFDVEIFPSAGYLINTGLRTFMFNLSTSGLGIVFDGSNASTYSVTSPTSNPNNKDGPFGLFNYALDCQGHNGGGDSCGQSLKFTVTNGAGLLLASTLSSRIFFAADIFSLQATNANAATGAVGATFLRDNAPEPTPVPGAAFLMGSVLAGGMGFGAWRRRRREKFAA